MPGAKLPLMVFPCTPRPCSASSWALSRKARQCCMLVEIRKQTLKHGFQNPFEV